MPQTFRGAGAGCGVGPVQVEAMAARHREEIAVAREAVQTLGRSLRLLAGQVPASRLAALDFGPAAGGGGQRRPAGAVGAASESYPKA